MASLYLGWIWTEDLTTTTVKTDAIGTLRQFSVTGMSCVLTLGIVSIIYVGPLTNDNDRNC